MTPVRDPMSSLAVRTNQDAPLTTLALSFLSPSEPPGRLIRTKRCTVYLDQYIECTITAPIMVQAIAGGLEYEFRFIERPLL